MAYDAAAVVLVESSEATDDVVSATDAVTAASAPVRLVVSAVVA